MTIGNKKVTVDYTIRMADVIKVVLISLALIAGYFKLSGDVNRNSEWVNQESKPFHKLTEERLHELDKRQAEMYEQIKAIGITTIDIKEELKYIRSKK